MLHCLCEITNDDVSHKLWHHQWHHRTLSWEFINRTRYSHHRLGELSTQRLGNADKHAAQAWGDGVTGVSPSHACASCLSVLSSLCVEQLSYVCGRGWTRESSRVYERDELCVCAALSKNNLMWVTVYVTSSSFMISQRQHNMMSLMM